jgi:uncharacterized membrane protein
MSLIGFCRGLFAIASASLGLLILAYGDFAPGALSWPDTAPLREAGVYGSALLVLAASIGVCFSRVARTGTLTIGAYFAAWAALSVPGIFAAPLSLGAWYAFVEALSALAGAWILLALLRLQAGASSGPFTSSRGMRAAQFLFGLTCVFYGASHFAYAEYTAGMVPGWLGRPMAFAYITGACHVAAGLGMMLGILPRLAATLEALMMSLFGLLVWVPSFFADPRPDWATPPQNQWSELVVNLVLASAAWLAAASLAGLKIFSLRSRA